MIQSVGGVISTEQPESEHVHHGFMRKDDMGQTIMVTCSVPYHQHFDGDGEWLSCDAANKKQRVGGRVIKSVGHSTGTDMPVNLPR